MTEGCGSLDVVSHQAISGFQLFSSNYKSFSRYDDERCSLCFGQPIVFPDRRRKQKSNSIFVHIFANSFLFLHVIDSLPSYGEPWSATMGHVLKGKRTSSLLEASLVG